MDLTQAYVRVRELEIQVAGLQQDLQEALDENQRLHTEAEHAERELREWLDSQ
jgi:regulator of replication initiation timing